MHWHQPHTFSELTRAGLAVTVSDDSGRAHWHVGDERRSGTIEERDEIARRGWDRFVEGAREALPQPHAPLAARDELPRFDRLTIAERIEELDLDEEERDVLAAEAESVAHGPLTEAGAVSILRWHALSGYSLELAQFTGGRVTIDEGTGALLAAIADAAPFDRRLEHTGRGGDRSRDGQVEVAHARRRDVHGGRRDRGRRAERSRRDRVQPRAAGGQAPGDRARPGQPRRQGDDPRARRRRAPELDPLPPPVRLSEQRDPGRRRDAADDRLRRRRHALRPGRPARHAGEPRRRSCPATRSWTPRRTTGSPTSSRAAPGPSTARAGTSTTMRPCADPRATSSSPARTWPTDGPGSSTVRSSRDCARAPGRRRPANATLQAAPRPPAPRPDR